MSMSRSRSVRIAAARAAVNASARTGRPVHPEVLALANEKEPAVDDDTIEFDPASEDGAPWAHPVNRDEDDVPPWQAPQAYSEEEPEGLNTEPKAPEPALVRAFLVAAVGFVGAIVGKSLNQDWIDPAIAMYAIASPIVLGWWIRRNVSPVRK